MTASNFIKFQASLPRYVLKAINRPLQLAERFHVFFSSKTFRLAHINFLLKITIEECGLYIHLMKL